MPLFVARPEQVARELARAAERSESERAWRKEVRRLVSLCFVALFAAIIIGLAGFGVSDPGLGSLLLELGKVGSVAFPSTIVVIWVGEASRRGDL